MSSISKDDLFDFGEALNKMREGLPVGRVAWVTYHIEITKEPFTLVKRNPQSSAIETMSCIVAVDCLNRVIPWCPTHSDLLALDWISWETEEQRLKRRSLAEVKTLEQFREEASFITISPFRSREKK